MTNPLSVYLSCRDTLSAEERDAIESLPISEKLYSAKTVISHEGDPRHHCMLLLDGMISRSRLSADGLRSISALHIKGDFLDLQSLLLTAADHDLTAMSECRVAFSTHPAVRNVIRDFPHLGRLFWLSTLIEGATYRAWIDALGRKKPVIHLAHLVCELYYRMSPQGLVSGQAFHLPLTQIELADVLGLSTVHVNRTMQALRATRFLTWADMRITVLDLPSLVRFGQFDPDYLELVVATR